MARSITVVTTFSDNGWNEYGKRFVETFTQHWPKDIKLKIYCDTIQPEYNDVEWIKLNEVCPDLVAFKDRHKDNENAHGLRPDGKKKSYLWDAVKFAHKSYCVSHAALNSTTDLIIWLDADVVTHSPVPFEFIESLLPQNHYCAYLGREKIYPECGFVVYDTTSKYNNIFMQDWQDLYNTDSLFEEVEYHDSYLFWQLVKKHSANGMQTTNLSRGHPHRPGVHVFINSPLGEYMDHLKGKRKKDGRSKPTDIYYKRDADYWKKI
tara:strand:+ start:1009 stop:1800 length:792 start_codon:yes stop_codon:yes gene_type:complete